MVITLDPSGHEPPPRMIEPLPCDDVISVRLIGGTIEVVKRRESDGWYLTNPAMPVPDRVWKEIYTTQDGEIVLGEIINGTHVPARKVRERFEFDENTNG